MSEIITLQNESTIIITGESNACVEKICCYQSECLQLSPLVIYYSVSGQNCGPKYVHQLVVAPLVPSEAVFRLGTGNK